MPRGKRRIDGDKIYEAWQSFAADNVPGVINAGTQLRGDDPVVRAHPHWFVSSGTPSSEWPSELGTTEAPEPTPDPTCDVKLQRQPEPLEGVMELTRDVRVLLDNGAVTLATGGLPGRLVIYPRGARFPVDAELVARIPNAFKEI